MVRLTLHPVNFEPPSTLPSPPVPLPVYVRRSPVARLGGLGRGIAGAVAGAGLAVLGVAAWVSPDGRGVGTHEQLGLAPCGMVLVFGLPCPTCGFTTSFALFVRGQWWASAWNQPAGFVLALLTAMAVWAGAYAAVTGARVHLLVAGFATPGRVVLAAGGVLLAWAWKITLMKLGAA